MRPRSFPGVGYFELQDVSVNTSTPDQLAPGEQGRVLIGGLPLWQTPQVAGMIPFLNVVVRNYSEQKLTVNIGAGTNNVFSVDEKGFVQLTEFPYDDIILFNAGDDVLLLSDIKIVCYNDNKSLKDYYENLKTGLVMPYVRRLQ